MDRQTTRRAVLAAAAVSIAGCLGDEGFGPYEAGGQASDVEPDEMSTTPDDDAVDETALPIADDQLRVEYELETLREEVVDGGVPQDGIPSIDDPVFEPVDDVGGRLNDDDPVFGVVYDGEARAYPQSILVHHEIVNDTISGTPIAVTYCPLTGTAMGFERGDVEFGVSGRLLNSNLIMYDREGETWWPQMLGTAIQGPLEAASLREVPVHWSTWETWRSAYPDSEVLTEDTGHVRDYGDDPYGEYNPIGGYYEEDSDPIFGPLTADDRHPPKRMVVGARPPEGPFAIDQARLHDEVLIEFDHEGEQILAVHDESTGANYCYRNPEGASYTMDDGQLVDDDGASFEPGELPLESVYAYDAMWFAWAGFYPSTVVYE